MLKITIYYRVIPSRSRRKGVLIYYYVKRENYIFTKTIFRSAANRKRWSVEGILKSSKRKEFHMCDEYFVLPLNFFSFQMWDNDIVYITGDG